MSCSNSRSYMLRARPVDIVISLYTELIFSPAYTILLTISFEASHALIAWRLFAKRRIISLPPSAVVKSLYRLCFVLGICEPTASSTCSSNEAVVSVFGWFLGVAGVAGVGGGVAAALPCVANSGTSSTASGATIMSLKAAAASISRLPL